MTRMSRKKRTERTAAGMREYVIAVGLTGLVVFLAWAVWGIAQKEEIARKAMNDRQRELAQLEERRIAFEANLDELSTIRGQEATLRQNHGVAREGEGVIIVVPKKEEQLQPLLSPWQRFWGWFGVW